MEKTDLNAKIYWTLLTALALFFATLVTYGVEERIAIRGWSAMPYVYKSIGEGFFLNDWPNGLMVYDQSLPMRAFVWLKAGFGIEPETTTLVFSFLVGFIFTFSLAYACHALFPSRLVSLVFTCVALSAPIAGLNFSNFGNGFASYPPYLYYNLGNALRLFAIGAFFQNRYLLSSLLFVAALLSHFTMAVFALAFVGAYYLLKPKELLQKDFRLPILVLLLGLAGYVWGIGISATGGGDALPVDDWITYTKQFSFHWYPVGMHFFDSRAHYVLFPTLFALMGLSTALSGFGTMTSRDVRILCGVAASLVMVALGVVVTEVYPVPLLIKVALPRMSALLTFFATMYWCAYLVKHLQDTGVVCRAVACLSFVALFAGQPGLALLPLLFFMGYELVQGRFFIWSVPHARRPVALTLYGLFVTAMALLTLSHFIAPIKDLLSAAYAYFGTALTFFKITSPRDFFFFGGRARPPFDLTLLLGLSGGLLLVLSAWRKTRPTLAPYGLVLAALVLCVSIKTYTEARWLNKWTPIAHSFMDVQNWAKNKTDKDAVFLLDPSIVRGWRDFSYRASYGSIQEWGFSVNSYLFDPNLYKEGRRRLALFGVDLDDDRFVKTLNHPTGIASKNMFKIVRKKFNTLSDKELSSLMQKENIDYTVFEKQRLKQKIKNIPVAYQNKHYIVFLKAE